MSAGHDPAEAIGQVTHYFSHSPQRRHPVDNRVPHDAMDCLLGSRPARLHPGVQVGRHGRDRYAVALRDYAGLIDRCA
jgi:hypothetical protein